MGVAAHALDEAQGRPLETRIGRGTLSSSRPFRSRRRRRSASSPRSATSLWLLAFVAAGAFIAVAYNLELFGGRLHGDLWFALGWGALPVLATYFAAAETIRLEAVVAAAFAALAQLGAASLSTPVRSCAQVARSRTDRARDGEARPITRETLIGRPSARCVTRLRDGRPRGRPRPAPRNLTPVELVTIVQIVFAVPR